LRFVKLFVSLLAIAMSVIVAEPLFGRQQTEVRIEKVYAVRECTGRNSRVWGLPRRSSVPAQSPGSFCGLVRTDMGVFDLPDDGWIFRGMRAEMLDILKEDCIFEVTVSGFGPALEPGAGVRTTGVKTLRSIDSVLDCTIE
jgi:hypothetical protein